MEAWLRGFKELRYLFVFSLWSLFFLTVWWRISAGGCRRQAPPLVKESHLKPKRGSKGVSEADTLTRNNCSSEVF